ncbi:MAG TPA: hypothetical protein PLQ32_03370 [Flavihumibacter sp.]|mgnify:CR=1 FL=1|nr:hypothetical protein [Bacteroidota bacterium]HOA37155.1 hypothetical protein [Flavihumibacter sp.]HPZ87118.1 hypothetical protein [Flavihumibacter sp.]HQD10808.1 hypothetical protein [Flavihumibacter sp.]
MTIQFNETALLFTVEGDRYTLAGPAAFLQTIGGQPIQFRYIQSPGAVTSLQFVYPDNLRSDQEQTLKAISSALHEELDTEAEV